MFLFLFCFLAWAFSCHPPPFISVFSSYVQSSSLIPIPLTISLSFLSFLPSLTASCHLFASYLSYSPLTLTPLLTHITFPPLLRQFLLFSSRLVSLILSWYLLWHSSLFSLPFSHGASYFIFLIFSLLLPAFLLSTPEKKPSFILYSRLLPSSLLHSSSSAAAVLAILRHRRGRQELMSASACLSVDLIWSFAHSLCRYLILRRFVEFTRLHRAISSSVRLSSGECSVYMSPCLSICRFLYISLQFLLLVHTSVKAHLKITNCMKSSLRRL